MASRKNPMCNKQAAEYNGVETSEVLRKRVGIFLEDDIAKKRQSVSAKLSETRI